MKNTMITLKDCIQFTNENQICYLATVENNQPRVRTLGFWFADESGFYFQTSKVKEIPHQLELNPNVEACFYHHEGPIGTMLRIAGKAEFVDSPELREKALKDRPFLTAFGMTVENPGPVVFFRIAHGKAHFWKMENNMKPKDWIEF
jgi:pyridoxamine 5'-phosphate oxidase